MLREMPLAALLPIRDACPLYYPQKSAEPAPTKRLRALLGTEAVFGAAVAATALLAALFMREPLVAACTYAIFALLGVSSLRRVDRSLVSGLSLSVCLARNPLCGCYIHQIHQILDDITTCYQLRWKLLPLH